MAQRIELPSIKGRDTSKSEANLGIKFQKNQYGSFSKQDFVQDQEDQYTNHLKKNSMTIIPYSEIEKIKSHIQNLNPKTKQSQEGGNQQSTWAQNVLKNLEKRKEDALQKFIEKENHLRKLDQDEEEYQQNKKREIVNQANHKIFQDQDKVRTFKKKMLLADVQEEQKMLNQVKQKQKEIQQEIEEIYSNQEQELMQQKLEKEREEQEKLQKKRHEQKEFLKKQLQESKQKYIEQYKTDFIEGQMIKEKSAQAKEEEKQKQINKKLKHQQFLQEIKQDNDYLQQIKQHEKELDQEENKQIEKFQEQTEKVKIMKQIRSKVKLERQQQLQQKMVEQGIQRIKQQQDTEDARIQNQIKEAQEKERLREQRKQDKLKQLKEDIDQNIKQSIERKSQEFQQNKIEDQEYVQQVAKQYEQIDQINQKEKEFHANRKKDLLNFHKKQMNEKILKKREFYVKELEENENIRTSIETDKRVFQSWAEQCIDEWNAQGKNIQPMLAEYNKLKDQE